VVAVAPFAISATFGFVWDDRLQLIENPFVTGVTSWGDLFTHDVWAFAPGPMVSHAFYRPIPLAMWKALFAIFGYDPLPFHVANLVLHATAAVLVFLVARSLVDEASAAFGASLFAVHPLRVESVTWVSGAMDLLVGAFLLGSALAFLRFWRSGRSAWLAAGTVALVLALLSKEVAFAAAPFAILVVALHRPRERRAWLVAGVIAASVAAVALVRARFVTELVPGSLEAGKLLTVPVLLARYLAAMGAPWPHVLHSTMAPVAGLGDWRLLAAAAGLAAGAWLLHRGGVGPRTVAAALLLWIVLTLAPACVGASPSTLYAERYTYVPGMAAALLLAMLLVAGARRVGLTGRSRTVAVAGVVLACGVVSLARAATWRDEDTLFRAMIAQDERDPFPCFGLGLRLVSTGRVTESRALFERAVELDPRHSAALNALGNFALLDGRLSASADYYRRAVEAQPANLDALYGLGNALARSGRCEEARQIHARLWTGRDAESGAMQGKIRAIGDPLQGALLRCR
jgi:hypothetical protein